MKIADYQGYEIHVPTSGGKAGKGHQKTSSIQVHEPMIYGGSIIRISFRFQDGQVPNHGKLPSKPQRSFAI